ncbi:MAG: GYD domain-containing protein [Methanomicrobiales archaeon]|nr:GYD domain-containing protein [Methanomicrobiales archaeon]
MALFIVLGKLTDRAIAKMREAKERDEKAKQIIQAAGGRLIGLYYTLGRYDFIAIIELPSAEALADVIIDIHQWGTVSTESLTALLPEQMYKMAK